MGRIANLASNVGFMSTTLAQEMEHFVNIVIFIAVSMGAIFFILSMCLGYPWITAVSFLIGIICANVPEGLLSTICVSRPTLIVHDGNNVNKIDARFAFVGKTKQFDL
jgi:sodium/potassium-transporting ATPase subunit alpha